MAIVVAAVLAISADFQTLRKDTVCFAHFHYALGLRLLDGASIHVDFSMDWPQEKEVHAPVSQRAGCTHLAPP